MRVATVGNTYNCV